MSLSHAEVGRLQKKVAKYVWLVRDEMWLTHWKIDIRLEELEDVRATIQPTNNRHLADLILDVSGARAGGVTFRHTVVHELLHLWLRTPNDIIRLTLPDIMSLEGYKVLWESYRQAFELMVDDMAWAWGETLSLPPWDDDA